MIGLNKSNWIELKFNLVLQFEMVLKANIYIYTWFYISAGLRLYDKQVSDMGDGERDRKKLMSIIMSMEI